MKKLCFLFCLCLLAGQLNAQSPTSYCVENDITHAYLNDFSYDTIPDYNISYVRDYAAMPHDYRLDAPKPVRLSWTHEDGAEAQRIEISESNTYSDSIVFMIDKDTAEYDLYNMIPGKTYYYRIMSKKNDVTTVKGSGQIAPTGMLRMIYAEGTLNVRDMGGWKGLGGHPIAYGKIFRGARWSENSTDAVLITASGKEALRNAGIRAELDLRQDSESKLKSSPLSVNGDVDYVRVSNSVNARMNKFDAQDANVYELQWVINELRKGKPVYYHCSMGADRTGTLGFLIGALLGMSVNDLTKDYELTTFCAPYTGEDGFARIRYSKTKLGSPSNDWEPYTLKPLIDKMKNVAPVGASYQRKIYNFFKNGVGNTKISETDLDWFIKEMVDFVMVKSINTDVDQTLSENGYVTMQLGQTINLNTQVAPADATNKNVTYKSDNSNIAVVSADGVITAVGRGATKIRIQADDLTKAVQVDIPVVESVVPDSVEIAGVYYQSIPDNKIIDGSFEYRYFKDWTNAANTSMSKEYFDIKKYSENADSVYIESKVNGDGTSEGSIRAQWSVSAKRKTYVFGYSVKCSKDTTIVNNENLKVLLIRDDDADDDASAICLPAPSYDGNWTHIQYVFTSTKNSVRILFTHLSENGCNTCLDNFYLAELKVPAGFDAVKPVSVEPAGDREYYLDSHIKIVGGKKYLVK